jgi:hypothetical protein
MSCKKEKGDTSTWEKKSANITCVRIYNNCKCNNVSVLCEMYAYKA